MHSHSVLPICVVFLSQNFAAERSLENSRRPSSENISLTPPWIDNDKDSSVKVGKGRAVLCCVVSCCLVSFCVVSCCVVSCRVVSCRVVSCRVVLCRVVLCCIVIAVLSVSVLFYHSLSCRNFIYIVSCPSSFVSCRTLFFPCPTLFFLPYVVLFWAGLGCAICVMLLFYGVLCYTMLCYAMLCYAMLCYAILCYTILY